MPGKLAFIHFHTIKDESCSDLVDSPFAPGAEECLKTLTQAGYQIIYLSERGLKYHPFILEWLASHQLLPEPAPLVFCKSHGFQDSRMGPWAMGLIQTLLITYGADEAIVLHKEDEAMRTFRKLYSDDFSISEKIRVIGSIETLLRKLGLC